MIARRWQSAVALVIVVIGLGARVVMGGGDGDRGGDEGAAPAVPIRDVMRERARAELACQQLPPMDDDRAEPGWPVHGARPGPTVVVAVSEDTLLIDGDEVDDLELGVRLGDAVAADPDTQVVFRSEASVPHARIVQLMEQAKAVGVRKLAIGAVP